MMEDNEENSGKEVKTEEPNEEKVETQESSDDNSEEETNESGKVEEKPKEKVETPEVKVEEESEIKESVEEETEKQETAEVSKPKKSFDKEGKGGFGAIIFIMLISIGIAMFWESVPAIKNSVHAVLDPSAGWLLNWNLTWGMLGIVFAISLFTTLVQKYTTDQEALMELRKEQKILNEEMKKYKDNPEKILELQKKSFAFLPKTFKLTSRSIMYTGIPFILLIRWFHDYFTVVEAVKFFGFLSWFWFYLIFVIVFSSILRKMFKVV